MAEVERDLEVIFDVMPTSEDLPSKLLAEKVYALCYRMIIMHINCVTCMHNTYFYDLGLLTANHLITKGKNFIF